MADEDTNLKLQQVSLCLHFLLLPVGGGLSRIPFPMVPESLWEQVSWVRPIRRTLRMTTPFRKVYHRIHSLKAKAF